MFSRPEPGEYAPYYDTYFAQLPATGDLLSILRAQPAALHHLLAPVTDTVAGQPTAPGKWSIKEVLLHLIDCERVFAYRALAIARGEQQPLPGFDQDAYVVTSQANARSLSDLLAEYTAQRTASVELLRHLPSNADTRTGTASGHRVSVRALGWVIAAHEFHHYHLLIAHFASHAA
jgi:uncharacterized damage-inducible protein DinB